MNHFLIQSKFLLSGQNAPFTGEPQSIARFRDAGFTVYSSGNGAVTLQYSSPIFEKDWVDFYTFSALTTGYAEPAYLTTPLTQVRAISSGNGKFWCAFTAQN